MFYIFSWLGCWDLFLPGFPVVVQYIGLGFHRVSIRLADLPLPISSLRLQVITLVATVTPLGFICYPATTLHGFLGLVSMLYQGLRQWEKRLHLLLLLWLATDNTWLLGIATDNMKVFLGLLQSMVMQGDICRREMEFDITRSIALKYIVECHIWK